MIKITEEDLRFILENDFEKVYDLAVNNSFCGNCSRPDDFQMSVETISLDYMNDVIFHGNCTKCGGKMARVVEIGEQKKYFLKTKYIKDKQARSN